MSWIAGGTKIARGGITYAQPGSRTLHVQLTATGERTLKHARGRLAVTAQGTFAPAGGGARIVERVKLSLA